MGRWMSDGQWIRAMQIVTDDRDYNIVFPRRPGDDLIIDVGDVTWQVHADGSSHFWEVIR